MNSLILAALLCANVFAGTTDAPKASTKKREKHMAIQWDGATNGGAQARAELIFTEEQWRETWKNLDRPAPPVDLKTHVAAVVFLGQRRTGGYSVEWLSPAEAKNAFVIKWREKTPEEDAMVMQMITDPWSIRLYPRSPKAIHLEKEAGAK